MRICMYNIHLKLNLRAEHLPCDRSPPLLAAALAAAPSEAAQAAAAVAAVAAEAAETAAERAAKAAKAAEEMIAEP